MAWFGLSGGGRVPVSKKDNEEIIKEVYGEDADLNMHRYLKALRLVRPHALRARFPKS